LERKRFGDELDRGQKIPIISEFIEKELDQWENSRFPKNQRDTNSLKLDRFFMETIDKYGSNK